MIVQLTKVEFAAREMEHIIRSVRKQGARFPNPPASKKKWAGKPGCQHKGLFINDVITRGGGGGSAKR